MCDQNDKNTRLEKAVRAKNLEEVKALLSSGANVNMTVSDLGGCRNNDTLLHCTSCAKIVKELLLRGANVNETNTYRETPLHAAITLGKDLEFVRQLLKHGAEVNATNRKGNTALNHAVKRQSPMEFIEELLKYGADINIKNREHRLSEDCYSPLDNAMRYPDQAKLLIKYALIRNFESDYTKIINLDVYENSVKTSNLSSFLNDCVCEIMQMKTDEIKIGLPLYNFVTNNFNSHLLSINSLSVRLSNIDYSVNYPIYNGILLDGIKPFLRRAALLEKLKRIQVYTLNPDENGTHIMLVPDSLPLISEHLSLDELLNLVVASKKCWSSLNSGPESDTELKEVSTTPDAKRARLS